MKHLLLFIALLFSSIFTMAQNPFAHKDDKDSTRAIFGADDMREAKTYDNFTRSVTTLVHKNSIDGNYVLAYTLEESLKRQYETDNISTDIRFLDQPTFGSCTGFMISPDLMVTAGHCIDYGNYKDWSVVFDYTSEQKFEPLVKGGNKIGYKKYISSSDLYKVKEVLTTKLDENTSSDYCVVRLDRPVTRRPFRFRTAYKVPYTDEMTTIGSPKGLPLKKVEGAKVVRNLSDEYFVTDLDGFPGNSGGPVFNSSEGFFGFIEGILVRGPSINFYIDEECECLKTSEYTDNYAFWVQGVEIQRIANVPWNVLATAAYENLEYAIEQKSMERLKDWSIYRWVQNEKTLESKENLLFVAAENDYLEGLKHLAALTVEDGSGNDLWDLKMKDDDGNSLFDLALENNNLSLSNYLMDNGFNPNTKMNNRQFPLMYVLSYNWTSHAEALLNNGAKADISDRAGNTPLHLAARRGDTSMARKLISNGADVFAKNQDGQTPRKSATKAKEKDMKKWLKEIEKNVKKGKSPFA